MSDPSAGDLCLRNKLILIVDDHEGKMIIQALNKEAFRLQNATSAFYFNLADRLDEQVSEYQRVSEAVLAQLHRGIPIGAV